MAKGREYLEEQTLAILALPAAKKQKLEEAVQPVKGKRSFWGSRRSGDRTFLSTELPKIREQVKETWQPHARLPQQSHKQSAFDSLENEDSIVASAECLLSLSNSQTSSHETWGVSSIGRDAALPASIDTSSDFTASLPLSQESVHFMGCNREPSPPAPWALEDPEKGGKHLKRRLVEVAKKPVRRRRTLEGSQSSFKEDSEPMSSWSEPYGNEKFALSAEPVRSETLIKGSRSVSTAGSSKLVAREIVGKQDVPKHISGTLLQAKAASLPQSLMRPVAQARKEASAPAKRAVPASRKQASASPGKRALILVATSQGMRGATDTDSEQLHSEACVETQESQLGANSDRRAGSLGGRAMPRAAAIGSFGEDDIATPETSDSQPAESCGGVAGPKAEQGGDDVKMERLYDFFGRPFRVYVPARLWGPGVENTPELQEQRERESRLVLSELGTMIGLKNARQYSPEFALSKMADEKVINLTSFELADKFLAKVTKNEATREQLRAHLRDVTLPRLRDGTLDATPKEEELDPTPILELANMVISMHETIRSTIGELKTPVDFETQIVKETRALEQATLEIVVVGKPGSAKSLTCNRLVVPGSDGMDGPFHPVPESRDHGTVVPIFVWKSKRPGLTTHVIGWRKERYVKLVERRFLAGGISGDELKFQYKCERVQKGDKWEMVCHCVGDRMVVPALEEAIPGVDSAGSSPKDRARFYTSRIREGYTPAQQLMIEKIRLESNAWEGLEESWELGDMVGFKEQETDLSDVRGVTDDIVREGMRGVPVIVHCCGDRERSEVDGILLLKLGIFDGTPDTFPVVVCPEKPSAEQTTEKIWQDNVIALTGGIKKPERLAARAVPNLQHLIQQQEAIVSHLHDALIVMQPVKPLNCPELKDRMMTTFMRNKTGSLSKSISIWLNVATGQLKRQAPHNPSPELPAIAQSAVIEQKLNQILRRDRRDFLAHFCEKTLPELERRVEDDLEEAASRVADELLERIPPEALETREARVNAFRAATMGAVQFGSDIAVCLHKFFSDLVDRGCEDRIQKQSVLLEKVYRLESGRTEETDNAEGALVYFTRAARVYIESQCQRIKDGSSAIETAIRWGAEEPSTSESTDWCHNVPQFITKACFAAMQSALENGDADHIRQSFISDVLVRFAGRDSRTRREVQPPLVRRLLTWAETSCAQRLNDASQESLQPLIHRLPLRNRFKLTAIRADVTKLAEEVQRHNIRMARNITHSVAYEQQQLPKPIVQVRPSKRPDFKLLPEVDFDGIEQTTIPGHEISLTDLRPEPRGAQTDPSDSAPSTSGVDSARYRVIGKLRVGDELIRKAEEYGNVTREAVKRTLVGEARTAARVVFHLSHLEHNQKETSVRFDFHSDVQQCTSISFVVCKENEAPLHRRLLYRVADTYLITIPDDSGVAAYFAAAQIVYWRLFTLDRDHGFGSYLVVQNNIDGVAEMSGRSLASKSSTLQRAATFLQQTLLQERQRSQRALLKDLSSREALLHFSDLLLDDLLDRDVPPGKQLTRDEQRELTRLFETTFSPDRKLQDFPVSDFLQLLAKCKARRTRRWLLTCAQKLHPTLGVSIHMPRDQLHVYIRDVYPDTVFQAKTAVPSFFLLVDMHATRVLSPLHVAGYREEGHFNKRLLTFARLCFKKLEAQGRRSLASPVFCWRNKTFLRTRTADGLLDEQPIEDLDVTRIEKVWRQPPVPKAFVKPEGTTALDAKLPGPRQLRPLDTPVEGNGLAAAVSSVLTSSGAVSAATLRQQVGQFVKQNYKALSLPDVASAQAAKKWAEGHAKEGSGLELDFVYALAQAKGINVVVALVNEHEQLRFYIADAKVSNVSYVFGFTDGTYSPIGWRKDQEAKVEQDG